MGKIRLRHGDDEIEVDGTDAFVQKQLEQFYARIGLVGAGAVTSSIKQKLLEKEKLAPGKTPTPAEYFKTRARTDGVSQILIFGKYLEQFENVPEFTQRELNRVAKDAKLSKDIHAQYFTNAVKQGLLRKQGQKYSLTLSAEEVLSSMSSAK